MNSTHQATKRPAPAEPSIPSAQYCNRKSSASRSTWHQRLGHVNDRDLTRLMQGQATGISITSGAKDEASCIPCIEGKMTGGLFPAMSSYKSTRPGQLIFSDIEGPFPTKGINGQWRYYVTYMDHFERQAELFLLRKKSDQIDAYRIFSRRLMTRTGRAIEEFQTDNDGAYLSGECRALYEKDGTHHRTIVAGDSQQNGIPERLNRFIMDNEGTMRFKANLPDHFWTFSVAAANYLHQYRPSNSLPNRMTPYERRHNNKPCVKHLRVFGCDAFYFIHKPKRKKLMKKARAAIFVGYTTCQKAYKLWDVQKRQLIVSRNVIFHETSFTIGRTSTSKPTTVPRREDYIDAHYPESGEDETQHEHTDGPASNDGQETHHDNIDIEPPDNCNGTSADGNIDVNDSRHKTVEREEGQARRFSTRSRPPIQRLIPGANDAIIMPQHCIATISDWKNNPVAPKPPRLNRRRKAHEANIAER